MNRQRLETAFGCFVIVTISALFASGMVAVWLRLWELL